MVVRRFVSGVAAISLSVAGCAPSAPKPKPVGVPEVEAALDHFLCYFPQDNEFQGPKGVSLKDQWTDAPLPAAVGSRQLLCNPASKDDKRQRRVESHLLCYDIGHKAVEKVVRVTNQLDPKPQQYTVVQERYVCLPTGKKISEPREKPQPPPKIPTDLDHFKCYALKREPKPIAKAYQVTDQFHDYGLKNFEAVLLCNPVEKFRDGKSEGRRLHEDAHLVCYQFEEKNRIRVHYTVRVANQFEPHSKFDVDGPILFCFPSLKETVKAGTSTRAG